FYVFLADKFDKSSSNPLWNKDFLFVQQALIRIDDVEREHILTKLKYIIDNPAEDLFGEISRKKLIDILPQLLKQTDIMSTVFDILVTNPPYMGNKYMNPFLTDFMNKYYPENKSDTFSAFVQMGMNKVSNKGLLGFLTPLVWMFISSYENLRSCIINKKNISSLIQLEYNAFPEACVPVCSFVLRNYPVDINGVFIRLANFTGTENQSKKTLEAIQNPLVDYRYTCSIKKFNKIKGTPIAYWVSDNLIKAFDTQYKVSNFGILNEGVKTRDNERFLRLWYEVDSTRKDKWKPYSKGGGFKKWYGNNEYVINWEFNGKEVKEFKKSSGANFKYFFQETITWSAISSYKFSVRYINNSLFGGGGSGITNISKDKIYLLLGLLNTNLANEILNMLSSTLNYEVGNVSEVPIILEKIDKDLIDNLVKRAIEISKDDWDSYETSWDFGMHPLIRFKNHSNSIEDAFNIWEKYKTNQFNELKSIEEELNRLFNEAYGIEKELTSEVIDGDITIHKADRKNDIKSFISYAVGCMFGRYSLDQDGLVYAGGVFQKEKYKKFKVDEDNILPIVQGAYFEDDIVTKFVHFVEITFGKDNILENLDFIARILGKKDNESSTDTIRRYFLNDFFQDHINVYSTRGRKAPIYWLFTSGKQKAFNCLIYMHRYDKTTLSRIRTDYLHELQIRLDAEKKSLLSIIEGGGTAKEISNAKKELKTLDLKIEELKAYDELLHHMADMQIEIDLDDGVAVNYAKFNGLLAKLE
ncbi:BREX-1 system adenine-specific DNA-methyltransferase PglX, partial [Cohnella thermotolerans]|uniref:BREX-1 system adenine-specific DNA-methyltransferase PglX n=1 Tax=Cohnella thermotolerans TaxID=329858 RepID=UPI0012EB5BCD